MISKCSVVFKYMWRKVAHVTTEKVLCYVLYIKQIHLKQVSRAVNYSKAELLTYIIPTLLRCPQFPLEKEIILSIHQGERKWEAAGVRKPRAWNKISLLCIELWVWGVEGHSSKKTYGRCICSYGLNNKLKYFGPKCHPRRDSRLLPWVLRLTQQRGSMATIHW